MRIISYIKSKLTKKEHKFTIKWFLCDKNNVRLEKDFAISTVGVYHKEDIHDKRLINKTLNPKKYIKELVKNDIRFKDCELSYNVICYYGYMKR